MNFWSKLKYPIVGLSPMDGVTDAPFRFMVAKYGRPDVMYTEFVSVDGIRHGGERVFYPFIYDEIERPVVAQVFGKDPELFYQAAVIVSALGFDGMDINMGCPAKKVESRGSGAGLIRTPDIAQEIVRQSRKGIEDYKFGRVGLGDLDLKEESRKWIKSRAVEDKHIIPVSVKTRIGVDKDVAMWWMEALMEVKPTMIALHGRTLKQMYQGMADWESIAGAAEVVHRYGGKILGNGDVDGLDDAEKKIKEHGVDGVLIGRGSFGNPGVFKGVEPDMETRMKWIVEHSRKYEEIFVGERFVPIRKHLAWYAKGFPGASELRARLVRTESVSEVEEIVSEVIS